MTDVNEYFAEVNVKILAPNKAEAEALLYHGVTTMPGTYEGKIKIITIEHEMAEEEYV